MKLSADVICDVGVARILGVGISVRNSPIPCRICDCCYLRTAQRIIGSDVQPSGAGVEHAILLLIKPLEAYPVVSRLVIKAALRYSEKSLSAGLNGLRINKVWRARR